MIKLFVVTLCVWISVELAWAFGSKNSKYTNRWLVINEGEEAKTQQVSGELGRNYKREVKWTKQQRTDNTMNTRDLMDNNNQYQGFGLRKLIARIHQGDITKIGTFSTRPVEDSQLADYKGPTRNIVLETKKISAYERRFKDPLWLKQWYVQDYRVTNGPVMDHNVVPVYKKGFTGQWVTVAVVDDLIDINHPDLKTNIDIKKSYDLCLDKPLTDVLGQIKVVSDRGNHMGGIIAMEAKNDVCGVGIAYNAKIATINNHCEKYNGLKTNEEHLKEIIQNFEMVDIYNFSWGPDDNPSAVSELQEITRQAYEMGVKKGRKGKGVIYVQSAGNGGDLGDNCATDGDINQPNVIAITSATQYGKRSDYGETCTAIFATTYSGSLMRYEQKMVEGLVSTGLGEGCDTTIYGSSGSCAVASGIIALLLSARPDLSYRDVMHIITRSAEVAPLADNYSWYRNGQGFWVSNEFGFGLMNAENMVVIAQDWKTVPEKHTCVVKIKLQTPEPLSAKKRVSIPFETKACSASRTENVEYLEHLEVIPIVKYPRRGDIRVKVISAAGTKSVLLDSRTFDQDPNGLEGWPILSLHNWGENPQGKWFIEFEIDEYPKGKGLEGIVNEFTVKFHGIGERPRQLVTHREYAAFRLPNGLTNNKRII